MDKLTGLPELRLIVNWFNQNEKGFKLLINTCNNNNSKLIIKLNTLTSLKTEVVHTLYTLNMIERRLFDFTHSINDISTITYIKQILSESLRVINIKLNYLEVLLTKDHIMLQKVFNKELQININ